MAMIDIDFPEGEQRPFYDDFEGDEPEGGFATLAGLALGLATVLLAVLGAALVIAIALAEFNEPAPLPTCPTADECPVAP